MAALESPIPCAAAGTSVAPPPLRALARHTLAVLCGAFVLLAGIPSFAALALGALLALCLGASARSAATGKALLQWGVVGLGAGLDLGYVVRVGSQGFATTAATLSATLALGAFLGRRLGVGRDAAALVSVGTAICGGSAIAAAAPALRARAEDVGVALGVVFALNAVALLVFPLLGRALNLDPLTYGRWCALAVHDTSSVVGAAAAFGPEALEVATVTKLARALWIVPVVLVLGHLRARTDRRCGTESNRPARGPLPYFILAFLAAAALVTFLPALAPAGEVLSAGARRVLCLALFALGLGIDVSTLRRGLGRAMVLGIVLFAATTVGSLLVVLRT
jgi:uncharacterized integral membrane protein (TIGR00698 family)